MCECFFFTACSVRSSSHLQIFAIFAFSTCGSYSGMFKMSVECKNRSDSDLGIEVKFEYPFRYRRFHSGVRPPTGDPHQNRRRTHDDAGPLPRFPLSSSGSIRCTSTLPPVKGGTASAPSWSGTTLPRLSSSSPSLSSPSSTPWRPSLPTVSSWRNTARTTKGPRL